jgi:acetylornithine/succinyldiaminopimelate/putrescine aminotransferase
MGGARVVSAYYLAAARALCSERGALLIFDEVQCGVGRCGAFTAAEVTGVTPDLLTMAKGLASGLPIGAVMTTPAVSAGLKVGDLGSTFGGGPVPCAAALATLEVIDTEELIANAIDVGDYLGREALALGVHAVQGRGILLGLRLGRTAAVVQQALFERRILTGTANDPEILRLLPPLSFSRHEADLLLAALKEILN